MAKYKVGDFVVCVISGTITEVDETAMPYQVDGKHWFRESQITHCFPAPEHEPDKPELPKGPKWNPISEPPNGDIFWDGNRSNYAQRNIRILRKDMTEVYGWYGRGNRQWYVYKSYELPQDETKAPSSILDKVDASSLLAWREL